jgi:RNA polymerase sigma-70 factor, ECF subfamily
VAEQVSRGAQWFEGLFREHKQLVYRFMARRLPPEDVADAVAEVFVTAWRCRARLGEVESRRAWIMAVATRIAGHSLRSTRRRRLLFERVSRLSPPPVSVQANLMTGELRQALMGLSVTDRLVVELVLWEGFSHAEAADILGCTTNAVGVRLHRARVRVQALIGEVVTEAERPVQVQAAGTGRRKGEGFGPG